MTKKSVHKMHATANYWFLVSAFLTMIVAMTAVGTKAFMTPSSRRITRGSVSNIEHGQAALTAVTSASQAIKSKERLSKSMLRMADVPRDPGDEEKTRKERKRKQLRLPPLPEDQFTMTGDLIALFIYGFMDHLVNDMYLPGLLDSSPSAEAAAKALDPSGSILHFGVPVWIDTTWTSVSEQALRFELQHQVLPAYAPVLSTAGLASVSLAFCWLLAGYCLEAFSFRNTLDCSTHHAVQITGKAWVLSSFFMLVLACVSRYYLEGSLASLALGVDQTTTVISQVVPADAAAQSASLFQKQLGMLTVSDTEFIFDSLGVLLTWRVMISLLLGYGRDD